MSKIQTRKSCEIPMLTRQMEISSFDPEKRTAEMVFAKAGARVHRFNFFEGEFIEELSMEPGAVNLSRVEAGGGMPFLRDHGSSFFGAPSISDVLGRVIEARVDGEQGIATVEFSERDEVQGFISDIRKGILKGVSVGFRVNRFEKVGEENGIPILRAVDWELLEISSVAIGADPEAGFRNQQNSAKYRCEIVGLETDEKNVANNEKRIDNEKVESQTDLSTEKRGVERMDNKTEQPIQELTKEQKEALKAEGVKAEMERQDAIRTGIRKLGLGDDLEQQLIADGVTIEAARTAMIDAAAEKAKEQKVQSVQTVQVGEDNSRAARIKGATQRFLSRYDSTKYEVTDEAREYMGCWSILDVAKAVLTAEGVRGVNQMSKEQLARRALHTTSDFPEILANVANKTLRDAYMEAPQTFMPFTRRVQVSDFKQISRTQLGDAPDLLEVPESGEIKHGTIGEAAEKYQVEDYARIIAISRKTLVNDDLSAFTRVPELMGRAARDLESDKIYSDIIANPNMGDGNPLFDATHSNVGTAGAISDTTLAEVRANMRNQVGLNGRLLNIQPSWLWVPPALETAAEKQISSIQPNATSQVNPFGPQGRTPMQIIVEPRLGAAFGGSDTAWYASSTLGQIDMYELATLEGQDGPQVLTEELFDVLGMKIRIVHTIGWKAIDWRGLHYNAG